MLPCNYSCVFVFLQRSFNTIFGIASDSDTQHWYQKCVEKENANLLSFVHTELLETNVIQES